jgi:hypothetical protein
MAPSSWRVRDRVPGADEPARREARGPWPAVVVASRRRSRLGRGVRLLTVTVGFVAIAALLLWLRELAGAIASDGARLSLIQQAIARPSIPPSPPPSASWSCVQQAPRTYICAAKPAPGSAGTVEWLLDGVPYSSQSRLLVHLPEHSAQNTIQLQMRVSAAVYDLGAQELNG